MVQLSCCSCMQLCNPWLGLCHCRAAPRLWAGWFLLHLVLAGTCVLEGSGRSNLCPVHVFLWELGFLFTSIAQKVWMWWIFFVFIKMSSYNSGQHDWKIVKFCLVGIVWKTWCSSFCVQVMQNIKLWLLWNCSAGNTFSRQLLRFLLCFCHFVKICKLQLQPFEGKKFSAEVYWVWKVWFIFRNAKLKLAQHEERTGF